jgi:hypothetical protein
MVSKQSTGSRGAMKFRVCAALSVVAILLVLLVGVVLSDPWKVDGQFYWERALKGEEREAERTGRRIVFLAQGRGGLRFYWAGNAEIDRTRGRYVKAHVDSLLVAFVGPNEVPLVILEQLRTLAGYDPSKDKRPFRVWWSESRDHLEPTAQQTDAFLTLLRAQAKSIFPSPDHDGELLAKAEKIYGETVLQDMGQAGYRGGYLDLFLSPMVEKLLRNWPKDAHRALLIELCYFPALIFFTGYVIPWAGRIMRGAGCRKWSAWTVMVALFSGALVCPHVLGYAPSPILSTGWDRDVVLYGYFLNTTGVFSILLGVSLLCGMMLHALTELAAACVRFFSVRTVGHSQPESPPPNGATAAPPPPAHWSDWDEMIVRRIEDFVRQVLAEAERAIRPPRY